MFGLGIVRHSLQVLHFGGEAEEWRRRAARRLSGWPEAEASDFEPDLAVFGVPLTSRLFADRLTLQAAA